MLLGIAKTNHWDDATPPKGSQCTYQVLATYSFLGSQIEGERSAAAQVGYYPFMAALSAWTPVTATNTP